VPIFEAHKHLSEISPIQLILLGYDYGLKPKSMSQNIHNQRVTHQRPKSGISFGSRKAAIQEVAYRLTLVETFAPAIRAAVCS
jgi:hypothetical protein